MIPMTRTLQGPVVPERQVALEALVDRAAQVRSVVKVVLVVPRAWAAPEVPVQRVVPVALVQPVEPVEPVELVAKVAKVAARLVSVQVQ